VGVLTLLFVLCLAGIAADTIVKVAKSRGGGPALRAKVDDLEQLVGDQSAALADAQAIITAQSDQIQELAERVDFAERLLSQSRQRALERGGGEEGKQGSEARR
jgi:hypothetical protein